MSHYKPYPAYKDSRVEWLGKVPEHWAVKPLKYGLQLLNEKTSARSNMVSLENIEGWTGRHIETEADYQGEGVAFLSGDVLFGKLRPYLAKVMLASESGQAIGDFYVMRPRQGIHPKFAQYWLFNPLAIDRLNGSTLGAKMPRVNWDDMGALALLAPEPLEQQAIVTHLDRETTRIDALVDKKNRFMELLREKRQALITHAVTKGLDSSVKMKNSGVEWLGEMPEHWTVKKLKWLASLQSGDFITSDSIEENGPYPVYGGNGLRGYTTAFTHEGKYALIGRQGALCGNVNYTHGKFWASEHAVVVSATEPVNTLWLGELLRTMDLNQYSVSAAQPGLAVERITDLYVPVAPLDEQNEIAIVIDRETTRIDTLIQKTKLSTDLLKERRAALITAAVTGQIDLREAA